ncbi:unnamed protein product [Trichogramma brassicae]|uniref:Uncharacterized protein n=1 Tax=Trichogramma brassicae TaxID=86971 RepID=A0A6H5I2M8_9HYME|nr:unnamed protein product [Trichogramma brassicae]
MVRGINAVSVERDSLRRVNEKFTSMWCMMRRSHSPGIHQPEGTNLLTFLATSIDIAQMYRQIWVHPDDRKYQRVLWLHNGKKKTCKKKYPRPGIEPMPDRSTQNFFSFH